MRTILFAAFLCLPGLAVQAQGAPTVYSGACDGSAAVALDANHFAAGNDDDNSLRIYRFGASDPISPAIDLNPVLKPERKKKNNTPKEVDTEGAARVGDRIYWIGSHGRDKDGDEETSRHRLFATGIGRGAAAPSILPPTGFYSDLLKHLIKKLPELEGASKLAPEKDEGLNIEGLAAAPDGALLIGLRNPRPGGKAIVVPLTNPAAVVDTGADPKFGEPERLDLGKRGIRSIDYVGARYAIVAGPFGDNDNDFALFTWSGPGGPAPVRETIALGNLKPEALFATANPGEVYLLSDDGTDACKDLKDRGKKTFRGLRVKLN